MKGGSFFVLKQGPIEFGSITVLSHNFPWADMNMHVSIGSDSINICCQLLSFVLEALPDPTCHSLEEILSHLSLYPSNFVCAQQIHSCVCDSYAHCILYRSFFLQGNQILRICWKCVFMNLNFMDCLSRHPLTTPTMQFAVFYFRG